ncbi:tRNA (adenosine(37)-N6)-dimethylallyltransferase MiaA [Thiolapillus brandeum]|uniref:tRNA dimethylallyltransferase n=1 Tax=Thiolapillus brandeum TaxID=1076588 RepID=A0A7U6JI01_9GAMM|nr:tRNA (adenosine(37)-N6)-dimethylallyltransferase MiaA [Thiolapillus brandeum]BAO45009.1 tRNA delta(2)-isopentenylpyrophosphate transferase [Thiolapillus brandeum]
MTQQLPPAIFVMGPTAAGKTDLAVDLAAELPVDLISVDSALVYRGMDIGTAKPEPGILRRAPHALVDICEPEDAYSAARFREDALQEMKKITEKGRIPLLVGGTMLYFRALEQGLSKLPPSDPQVRERLQQRMNVEGMASLHALLEQQDPVAAGRIHANDPQRILRALEVIELTGQPMSLLQAQNQGSRLPYRVIKLVRAPREREVLHERIQRRFQTMLELGFEEEVRGLMARPGFSPERPSMRAVGYRQMIDYLLGRLNYEEMCERGVIATRQLAKRQFTWLRREQDANWLDEESGDLLSRALKVIEQKGLL